MQRQLSSCTSCSHAAVITAVYDPEAVRLEELVTDEREKKEAPSGVPDVAMGAQGGTHQGLRVKTWGAPIVKGRQKKQRSLTKSEQREGEIQASPIPRAQEKLKGTGLGDAPTIYFQEKS